MPSEPWSVPLTIVEYLNKFHDIRQRGSVDNQPAPDLQAAYFGVTGYLKYGGNEIAAINTVRDTLGDQPLRLDCRRDFDSLLGFTDNAPLDLDVNYYPNPSLSRTLKKRLQVKYNVEYRGRRKEFDPGEIPNVYFGSFGPRHTLRLFFPALKSDARTKVSLTHEELQVLYEQIIYKAADEVSHHLLRDWPASFESAQMKDRNKSGGFSNSSVILPAEDMYGIGLEMRSIVDNHPDLEWAKGFFWGAEIRGVKDSTHHIAGDPEGQRDEIERRLAALCDKLAINEGRWFIDVGLEFSSPNQALIWNTLGHSHLLEAALDITSNEANKIMSNVRKYAKDCSTHLTSLSGFRAAFQNGIGPCKTTYLQVYTTDKSQTYHPEKGNFGKTITPKEAMKGNPSPWCQQLTYLYHDAAQRVDVYARIEARCPLKLQSECLVGLPADVVRRAVSCYRREIWWNFRACKLWSATLVLGEIQSTPIEKKCVMSCLLVIIALVYQINSLHSRPDDSFTGRDLQKAIYPLTNDMTHPDLVIPNIDLGILGPQYPDGFPYAPGGSLYVRRFFLPPQESIRFDHAHSLPENVFQRAFGCSIADSKRYLFQHDAVRLAHKPNYVPQRKGVTKERHMEVDEEQPQLFEQFAHVEIDDAAALGYTADIPEDRRSIQPILVKIWQQFPSDIIQKLGNPKSPSNEDSYSHLTQERRRHLRIDDINTLALGSLFNQFQYRRASDSEWQRSFDIMFPHKGYQLPASTKHFPGAIYYLSYIRTINEVDVDMAKKIRTELYTLFQQLAWVPASKTDRMWDYDATDPAWTPMPDPTAGGPRLYINPWAAGRPTFIRHQPARIPEEDEESSQPGDDERGHHAPANEAPARGSQRPTPDEEEEDEQPSRPAKRGNQPFEEDEEEEQPSQRSNGPKRQRNQNSLEHFWLPPRRQPNGDFEGYRWSPLRGPNRRSTHRTTSDIDQKPRLGGQNSRHNQPSNEPPLVRRHLGVIDLTGDSDEAADELQSGDIIELSDSSDEDGEAVLVSKKTAVPEEEEEDEEDMYV
ncbi:hypothetical protein BDZ97DRAFT_771108 [Flammula alnicola]|nr:hypothetical protein BDZ97DRAFT_771108 [Flammula alnicola]